MKILSISQIREADKYTVNNEPISSVDLMERAANAAFNYIVKKYYLSQNFCVFCGIGNNGGDGFIIARMLLQHGYKVKVYWIRFADNISEDCRINYLRLNDIDSSIISIVTHSDYKYDFKDIFCSEYPENVTIDAVFGSGLSRPLDVSYSSVIDAINNSSSIVLSIDIPSGLFGDISTISNNTDSLVVEATETISFQVPKISFFFPENYCYVGDFAIVNIGLDEKYMNSVMTDYMLIDNELCSVLRKTRLKFDHKGIFGHAMLIAGCVEKFGAAIMAAKSCMKSGVGLLSVDIPEMCYLAMNISLPEAMIADIDDVCNTNAHYQSIGIGPGIGVTDESLRKLQSVLEICVKSEQTEEHPVKLIIDADGLNLLSLHKELLDKLPSQTILTPHPKEFERLFGTFQCDSDRIAFQKSMSAKYNVIIIYKTAHTAISMPNGKMYFNSTGNPGMATAGSGDVLTGLITGLLARGYTPQEAAVLGVFSHGLAGDMAATKHGLESMNAIDIIREIKL